MAKILGALALKTDTGALDQIDGSNLLEGDAALVVTDSKFYFYKLFDSDTTTEQVPYVIKPAFNGANKRWKLLDLGEINSNLNMNGILTVDGIISSGALDISTINFPGTTLTIKSGNTNVAVFDKVNNKLIINTFELLSNAVVPGLNVSLFNGKTEDTFVHTDAARPFLNPVVAPNATNDTELVNRGYVNNLFNSVEVSASTDFIVNNKLSVNKITSKDGADLVLYNNDTPVMTVLPNSVSFKQITSVESTNKVNGLNAEFIEDIPGVDLIVRDGSTSLTDNLNCFATEPISASHLTRKDYVDDAVTGILTGASLFTGNVSCSVSAPINASHFTRKDYVDIVTANLNNVINGTTAFTGNLRTTADAPTLSNHLTRKDYTDTAAGLSWETLAVSGAAEHLGQYFANTSSGAFSILLPSDPADYTRIKIVDLAGTFDVNNLTVKRNGSLIMGLAEDLVLNIKNVSLTFVYSGDTYGWKIV